MSGAHWVDGRKEQRVTFLDDKPKASESLHAETSASSHLNSRVKISAANLSGKIKTKSKACSPSGPALPSDYAAERDAPDSPAVIPRATPDLHSPYPAASAAAVRETVLSKPMWQQPQRGQRLSSTQAPSVSAAQRSVAITPKPPKSEQEQVIYPETSLTSIVPVNTPVSSGARSKTALRITQGIVRHTGNPGLVHKQLNRVSVVNEIYSKWAQDDPIAQGTSATVRGSVQAVTAASNAKRFGAWSWRTSFGILRGTGSFAYQVWTQGFFHAAGSLIKKAAGGMFHFGAALLGKAVAVLLSILLVVFVIITPIISIIAPGTDMSFGISGDAADALYAYCTEQDAAWTARIHRELGTSGYDEVRLNGRKMEDPSQFNIRTNINQLLIFLQVKNASGTHTMNDLKRQIDEIYAAMYQLSTSSSTETMTETKTVHAGESLGTVVTSAYCACPICCGRWAGGPTASGVYPEANHTLAVDAYTPTVPMGTEIIMNGTLYKVEDTGAFSRFGVDFDVFFDSHSEALSWGHRSFEAFIAGPEGTEVEVTVTHTISIYNVSLTGTSLYQWINNHIDEESKSHMELINEFGAFAGYAIGGNPFGEGNRWITSERFGAYANGSSISNRNYVTVRTMPGREVFAPLDGTLSWSGSTATITKATPGNARTIKISGLSPRKSGGSVASGELIGTASSEGITITVILNGKAVNPVIYLANAPGSGGNEAIVEAALTQLGQQGGQPFWSWYGFGSRVSWCACFVSWCADQCDLISEGLIPKYSLCSDGAAWFQSNGQWADRGYSPAPGDIIFFINAGDTESHHTGIVISSDGSTVQTIEGNSGDAVRIHNYGINDSYILGYGLPAYS